jgi:hypothetical protein
MFGQFFTHFLRQKQDSVHTFQSCRRDTDIYVMTLHTRVHISICDQREVGQRLEIRDSKLEIRITKLEIRDSTLEIRISKLEIQIFDIRD